MAYITAQGAQGVIAVTSQQILLQYYHKNATKNQSVHSMNIDSAPNSCP